MKPSLGFVGAGKVGCTLARLWHEAGYVIEAVCSRRPEHAAALAAQVGARAVSSPEAVIDSADLTLLAVPDDVIQPLAQALQTGDLAGKAVVHTSGAHDAGALAALVTRGAMTGSLHPVFPFADAESALVGLPGAAFALEAEPLPLRGWLAGLVLALHGRVLAIPPGHKAAYHSALVIASNYTVTLYALAERLLLAVGAEREAADHALNTLVQGTAQNLRLKGIPAALTGPLVRADAGTIRAHLAALDRLDPAAAALYRQLARLSLPLVAERGITAEWLEQLLNQEA